MRALASSPGGGPGSGGMRNSRSQNWRKALYMARGSGGAGGSSFEQLARTPQLVADAQEQRDDLRVSTGRRDGRGGRCRSLAGAGRGRIGRQRGGPERRQVAGLVAAHARIK